MSHRNQPWNSHSTGKPSNKGQVVNKNGNRVSSIGNTHHTQELIDTAGKVIKVTIISIMIITVTMRLQEDILMREGRNQPQYIHQRHLQHHHQGTLPKPRFLQVIRLKMMIQQE
ncbi:hypothetical protein BLNAU_11523 [Blattamonas nauphoetae]|uniref:Uncharacterized protein n=1 Tax=Blattamonas nauphoetae TaxID=2049346 RepID=A0ABQ9XQC0_9EUKA|nr:hypothetical protein BLNAU_11523 [Blattamonas nauphoetae]